MARPSTHVEGLEQLRRDLRGLSKEAGREFDREARKLAVEVRNDARGSTPSITGETRNSVRVSSTFRGIAVQSSKPWFGQIEYGAKVWLRRGLPYAAGPSRGSRNVGSLPVRQVPAPPGRNGQTRVVNEAQYLIRRQRPIGSAADRAGPELQRQAEQMLARLQRKWRLS
jgi:hypothetical protein